MNTSIKLRKGSITFDYNLIDDEGYTVGFLDNNGVFYNLVTLDYLEIPYETLIVEEMPLLQYNRNRYQKLCERAPFKREIQEQFKKWYNDGTPFKRIVRITGPRQVGKTTEILKFAYQNYNVVNYVNFADAEMLELFRSTASGRGEITAIQIQEFCKKANLPFFENNSRTILIFDEIQDYPAIYTSIKAMNRNLECHIILTGSYLGELLTSDLQAPVGEIQTMTLRTLSFCEFCDVFEKRELLLGMSLDAVDSTAHNSLYELYEIYYQIGGYPDAVRQYRLTGDVSESQLVIHELLNLFLKEASKYTNTFKEDNILKQTLSTAFREICFEKKGADYNYLTSLKTRLCDDNESQINIDELARAYGWLIHSGVLGECGIYEKKLTDIALRRRIYFTDCGLANVIARTTNINDGNIQGALQEVFAYSELSRICGFSNGLVKTDIPYCYMFGKFELDFVITALRTGKKIGIEIKSKGAKPTSLLEGLEKGLVDFGVVAKNTTDGSCDGCITIPIYTVGTHFPYVIKEIKEDVVKVMDNFK